MTADPSHPESGPARRVTARARDVATLLVDARAGDRGALARLLSVAERGDSDSRELARLAHVHGGSSYTVGLTGAPGAGKSTLTGALASSLRAAGHRAAVLAIDPSSPFTGGALLGDRVRMGAHSGDDGVFIRSLATRGHLGGLSLATVDAIRVLDATGWPWVLVETVGVGQVEVDIAGAADTTVVVLNPGWGDGVQASKAGLLEIADIYVVNKADRPGARDTRRDLEMMLDIAGHQDWRPPVVDTVATTGEGADELRSAIEEHRQHLQATGELRARRRKQVVQELLEISVALLRERLHADIAGHVESMADRVAAHDVDPWAAAQELLEVRPNRRGQ